MGQRNRIRSSSLFLMELIIAILFFTIFSAVCVQFFAKSHVMNSDAMALNHAVNEVSNAAEILRASDELSEVKDTFGEVYPDGNFSQLDEDRVTGEIYYDENFEICKNTEAKYMLQIEVTEEYSMLIGDLDYSYWNLASQSNSDHSEDKDDQIIYDLSIRKDLPRRTGYEKE